MKICKNAMKIAVDLVSEGLISKNEAIKKVLPEHLDQLLHPRFPDMEQKEYRDAGGFPLKVGFWDHFRSRARYLATRKIPENTKN
jgi:hypothetical protein